MVIPTRDQQIIFKDVLVDALNRAGNVKRSAQALRSDIVTGDVGGERLVDYLTDLVERNTFFGNLPAGLGTFANGELSNPPTDLAGDVTATPSSRLLHNGDLSRWFGHSREPARHRHDPRRRHCDHRLRLSCG